CSGFVYAYVVAHGLLAIGAKRLLVIGTDTLSRITDWSDRGRLRNGDLVLMVGFGAGMTAASAVIEWRQP
ncbi:MAG: 3-oxoacyl-ACP synthase, partial [Actinobacteria bacterium]|nr:3-oxoacyl-ACP synthase [Actinomycetota bacterium]